MSDEAGGNRDKLRPDKVGAPHEDRIKQRAHKLAHGGEGVADLEEDPKKAERAAQRILEESEARTFDPATVDPDHDGVIRRPSSETASRGDRQ